MEIEVLNIKGEKTDKKVVLNDNIFNIEPNDHAIYLDVKHYMANQRQGTSKTKERGEVVGSTKKIKRQKGTGTARAGDIKSPIFKGGGRTFGPKPRDYAFKLNKKIKALARYSALTYKAKENAIIVVENIDFEEPKTKLFSEFLKNLKISDKKSLFVLGELNKNVYLSSRNLSKTKTVKSSNLNTYEILNAQNLVITEEALEKINSK